MHRGLQQLVAAEFLYQRGLPPQATSRFTHVLIQEAAYQSLLRSTRQQHHQRIAQVLEARFPEICETQPELVAQHYTGAGRAEQAVVYWQQAGHHASDRSAHLEAISHFTSGIELLKTLPETPERTQQAVTLHIALGAALQMTKGRAAPEVEQAYTQARAWCQQVGETPELVPVLLGLWRYYNTRPQCWAALGSSGRGWALAMQGQGEEGLVQVRQGIAAWRATGAVLHVPYFCTLLADVCDHLSHPEGGLQVLAEAHTLVAQQEERY